MRTILLFSALLGAVSLWAQTQPAPAREADFTMNPEGDGLRFKALPPPAQQIAGAPKAYYRCFWEFGDGGFSTEESPLHMYAATDTVEPVLHLTYHYDDGEMPKKKKKRKGVTSSGASGLAGAGKWPGAYGDSGESIVIKNNREPRRGEELTLVLSYRNNSAYTTDGVVHLFFNEKKFRSTHFQFQEARTHFGEKPELLLSAAETTHTWKTIDWMALVQGNGNHGGVSAPFLVPAPVPAPKILAEARGFYREEKAWRFSNLRPGETRNLFVTLEGSAGMIRDTSAFIHLLAVFAPIDPAVPSDSSRLEMEIVNSHDPNAIAVSDTRVGYRKLNKNRLDYKVRFQNNGERQAEKIELRIDIPEGLNAAKMEPLDWYPKCPICTDIPNRSSCLDTATTANGLVFTFRNIYLPGSNQRGVADYDSTKGYVKYRITPEKGMPKRNFSSRASIIFDKNPPIHTNFSKTRFKPGLSPGLKVGYGFVPDSFSTGYTFFGLSVSPYKSWKIYPQLELLTGLKGRSDLPGDTSIQTMHGGFNTGVILPDTVTYMIRNGHRRFVSFELPVLLRRNFSRFAGIGLGASARLVLDRGEDTVFKRVRQEFYEPNFPEPFMIKVLSSETTTTQVSTSRMYFTFFADLTLGSVRAGPNVGIRAGGILDGGVKPFVQASVEYKF